MGTTAASDAVIQGTKSGRPTPPPAIALNSLLRRPAWRPR